MLGQLVLYVGLDVAYPLGGRWPVTTEMGVGKLDFLYGGMVIAAWRRAGASTFAVSLPWYGGTAAFSWSLEGASELLIRAGCD